MRNTSILPSIVGTDEPIQCPAGTYRGSTLGQSLSDCHNCTGGYYCNDTKLTEPVGKCSPGYYCPSKSSSATEYNCPEGFYCPLGTEYPHECPEGTYSNSTRLVQIEDCPKCLAGMFCATKKLTYPTGPCKAGYYCPLGSASDTEEACPSAMHCPEGSAEPKHCQDGFFTDSPMQRSCTICPPGSYCISKTAVAGKLF